MAKEKATVQTGVDGSEIFQSPQIQVKFNKPSGTIVRDGKTLQKYEPAVAKLVLQFDPVTKRSVLINQKLNADGSPKPLDPNDKVGEIGIAGKWSGIDTTNFPGLDKVLQDKNSRANKDIDKQIIDTFKEGYKAKYGEDPTPEAISEGIDGIVPRKSINEIGKLVGDESENVVIKLGQTSIAINIAGTTFVSKLIEGKFPDYEQVIPSGESSLLVVDRKMFSESLSRVSVLSSEKYKGVKFLTKENSLNISANNPEKEQGEENLACEYKGEEIDIAFNVNYLQEILSTINSDKIEINFFGSDKSCLITAPTNNDLKYVVMPLLI